MVESNQDGVQTFIANSTKEALAQVRDAFGPDAIILDQQQVGERVSVRACLVIPEPAVNEAAPIAEPAAPESDVSAIERSLIAQGFTEDLIERYRTHDDVPQFIDAVLHGLSYRSQAVSTLAGTYRFIGSAGSGKTSLLIRLLADWVLHHGPSRVRVISLDDQRLGGTEGLQLACQLLDVSLTLCRSDEPWPVASETELTLIDTPALDTGFPLQGITGVQDIWVACAIHSVDCLQAQRRRLESLHLAGMALTHSEHLTRAAPIVSLLHRWGVPLHWLTSGAELPGGLEVAEPAALRRTWFASDSTTSSIAIDVAV